jgi:DNA repair protein RadC
MVCEIRVDLIPKDRVSSRLRITCSTDAYEIFAPGWEEINYRERFKVMFLNRNNRVIGIKEISSGGIAGTVVDVRMILQAALGVNASSMILAHNHPSGGLNVSNQDEKITKKIKQSAKIMDISVLDHVILTGEEYFSMADERISQKQEVTMEKRTKEKKQFILVQDVFNPFNPELHKDLTKLCRVTDFNYDYLKEQLRQPMEPCIYRQRYVIQRIRVEQEVVTEDFPY